MALESIRHPFVLSLRASYDDENSLYFLIEPAMGGELFRVMEVRSHVGALDRVAHVLPS